MFRILTKRILTCLFKKRRVIQHLDQNSQKVTKKVLVFRKVARSWSLTKTVAQNPKSCEKVAEQNLERPRRLYTAFRAANTFRVTWYEQVFVSDTPPKCLDRDCVGRLRTVTGHGNVYLSVREKQEIVVYQ